jgi:protein-glutamine gamma-glutamyltransferase
MKPPPLLLGAALLFWGWQSGMLVVGAAMAVVLEGARFIKARWEFSDEDFSRVWMFCSLLFLATLVYAFTANGGPSSFGRVFQNPTLANQSGAGASSARTGAAMFRWLPMIFFPFIAVQTFSTRETIPLTAISLFLQRRLKKAKQLGKPAPAERNVHIGYFYFAACLLAAAVHQSENATFFWGLSALLAWALWAQRSRRFAMGVWAVTFAVAITLGYFGQQGVGQLQRYIENLNPQLFSRFARQSFDPKQSWTMLGHIGELNASGKIVIRLEPKEGRAPTYLRAASYRSFRPRAWYAGSSKNDFVYVLEEPANSGNWPLLRDKTNTAVANIACYLEGDSKESGSPAGLLPLPAGSGRLENLPAHLLQKNSAGAVLATGPGLMIFDARFGPGETIDSPADTNEDLSVPTNEVPALDSVISDLQLKGQSTERALRTLAGYFADKFAYSTWRGLPEMGGTNETPLSRFVLTDHSGHCEYFATATVLLLRRLDIPARYAVGYVVHETSGSGYVVRLRDAHAWCLVWDKERKLWHDFDTTPASWVKTEASHASAFQWLSDLWSRIRFEFSKVWWGQSRLRQYLLWVFVPVLALLLYQIIFRRGRKRQRKKAAAQELPNDWPGQDSEFYQLEKRLAERGVPRGPGEPLSDWLLRVVDTPDFTELRGPLQELLRLHYRYRFDPLGLSETDREALRNEARKCLESLSRAQPEKTSRSDGRW